MAVRAVGPVPKGERKSQTQPKESKRDKENALLPVHEPLGDLELTRVLHDGDDALKLIRVELTGAV